MNWKWCERRRSRSNLRYYSITCSEWYCDKPQSGQRMHCIRSMGDTHQLWLNARAFPSHSSSHKSVGLLLYSPASRPCPRDADTAHRPSARSTARRPIPPPPAGGSATKSTWGIWRTWRPRPLLTERVDACRRRGSLLRPGTWPPRRKRPLASTLHWEQDETTPPPTLQDTQHFKKTHKFSWELVFWGALRELWGQSGFGEIWHAFGRRSSLGRNGSNPQKTHSDNYSTHTNRPA